MISGKKSPSAKFLINFNKTVNLTNIDLNSYKAKNHSATGFEFSGILAQIKRLHMSCILGGGGEFLYKMISFDRN